MTGTFSQIYIQIVFAVKNRNSLNRPEWEERLYQYMTEDELNEVLEKYILKIEL
jgi:hypothetical protein